MPQTRRLQLLSVRGFTHHRRLNFSMHGRIVKDSRPSLAANSKHRWPIIFVLSLQHSAFQWPFVKIPFLSAVHSSLKFLS